MLPVLKKYSDVSLYEQLYIYYKNAILTKKIQQDHKLPSVRKLAGDLGISNNTIVKAYGQLLDEGYIVSRPKKGLFVQQLESFELKSRPGGVNKKINVFSPGKKNKLTYLGHSAINEESFPLKEWRKVQQLALDDLHHQYDYDTQDSGLKEQLIKYLYYSRGVTAQKEQLIIGAGTNQLLSLLCMILKDQYKEILFEEPGFEQARFIFSSYGYTINTVPVMQHGIDLVKLKPKKKQLIYVTPSHQYPTGAVMPINNRLKLLAWAKKNDAYLIEDDYDAEFRHTTRPIPALQAIDTGHRVIYMGTFSKILLPTLRVAYMVLPEVLLPSFYPFRYLAYTVSFQIQRSLAFFMEKGYWEKHLRKMQKIYKAKYFLTIMHIKKIFGNKVTLINSQAGLSVLLAVHTTMKEEELVKRAGDIHIFIKGGGVTFYDPGNKPQWPTVFIGFGNLSNEQIPVVLNSLKRTWFYF